MVERAATLPESPLERELRALGRAIDHPATPDIAASVRARLLTEPTPLAVPRRRRPQRRWVALAAAVALLLVVGLALVPTTREGIAERLGLRGVEIELVPTVPATPASSVPDLLLGEPTDLTSGLAGVEFTPFQPPAALGPPAAVYLRTPPQGGQLSYVYLPRAGLPQAGDSGVGLLVSQFLGETNESFIGKFVEPDTVLEPVDVNGAQGFWLSGEPHIFFYRDADGDFQEESLRLAANVLVWEVDGITVRIESSLSKEETLALAQALQR